MSVIIVFEINKNEKKLAKKTKSTIGLILFLIQNHFTAKDGKRQNKGSESAKTNDCRKNADYFFGLS